MLSIIIPTKNEIKNNMIEQSFLLLSQLLKQYQTQLEILIVDSESSDGTFELAHKYNLKTLTLRTNSRAKRLNHGIDKSQGGTILLHHPRSILTKEAIIFLIENPNYSWGAFTHKFDSSHPILSFTSFYSNYIRGRRGIFYLDHCIFVKKELLNKVGNIPDVEIFEDTLLSRKLKPLASPILLPFKSTTSSIRFTHNGILKQSILNQLMKLKFYFQLDDKKMNKQYEKNLNLNSSYPEENDDRK